MKEKLEQALVEVIKKTQDSVSSGVDFLTTQIPDVVHQLLVFKLAEALMIAAICIGLLALLAWLNYRQFKHFRSIKDWELSDYPELVLNLFQVFPIAGLVLPMFDSVRTALMIWFAPKIYLMEYAANLVK